ncbi:hypothetical protein QT990_16550 [Microcoleus sp. T3_B1]|uniref:hypothetical protein n=1 Tax=Microcoleus sp. T3_B1 TaxID=3055425 RepID=UPI002FCF5336
MTQIEPNSELTGEDIPLSATQKVGETINKTENISQSPDLLDEGESEPYEFNFCTVKIHIIMRPDDGHPEGRIVEITATSHDDLPLLTQVRENSIGAWPSALQELLQRLASNLPNRKVSAQIRSSLRPPRKKAKPIPQHPTDSPVNKGEIGVQISLF